MGKEDRVCAGKLMIIDIPLDYQPSVGQTISVQLTGKVISVCLSPLEPNSIMVSMDTGEQKSIGPNTPMGKDPFVGTNANSGSSLSYGG